MDRSDVREDFRVGRSIKIVISVLAPLFVFLCLSLRSAESGQQQNVDPQRPVLDYRCPTYPLSSKVPIVLRAEVIGPRELYELPGTPIIFKWQPSSGRLLDGQGTGKATLDASCIASKSISKIEVKLEIEHAAPEVEREKTCRLTIDPGCDSPLLFDEYGGVSSDEELKHLDRFVSFLKELNRSSTVYIVVYAGRGACHYEAEWRGNSVVTYLAKHGLSQRQLTVVDGGFRESWTVDLFVQNEGTCGPQVSPTLLRKDVNVRGSCG